MESSATDFEIAASAEGGRAWRGEGARSPPRGSTALSFWLVPVRQGRQNHSEKAGGEGGGKSIVFHIY